MQERKCLGVKINKKSRPKMRKKNVWSKIVSRNSCVHVYAYPSWNEDQSGSEGITVLKNLSCLSSKWDPFLVTVTRGIPFCRVQVFIMAVRSRCSPANKYYRQANTNTCKYLTGLGVFFLMEKLHEGREMDTHCILGSLALAITVFSRDEILLRTCLETSKYNVKL